MTFNPSDILAVVPEIAILALAMIVILLELFSPKQEKVFQWVAVLGLMAVIALTIAFGNHGGAFSGMIALDGFSTFLIVLIKWNAYQLFFIKPNIHILNILHLLINDNRGDD